MIGDFGEQAGIHTGLFIIAIMLITLPLPFCEAFSLRRQKNFLASPILARPAKISSFALAESQLIEGPCFGDFLPL